MQVSPLDPSSQQRPTPHAAIPERQDGSVAGLFTRTFLDAGES